MAKTKTTDRRTKPDFVRRFGIITLVVLLPLAIYVWIRPTLAERSLQHSSVADLQNTTQHDPQNARAFYYLGLRLQQSGQLDAAAQAFSQASKLNPNDEKSWLGWASAAGGQPGGDRIAFGILSAFLKEHPNSGPTHEALAELFAQKQAYVAAYKEAFAAAQLSPQDAEYWRFAGKQAEASHLFPQALAAMQSASKLAPHDWKTWTGLGNAYAETGQSQNAITAYQQAVQFAPNEAVPKAALGMALLDQSPTPAQLAMAQQNLQSAIQLQPNLVPAYLALARCYGRNAQWAQVRDSLLQAEQREPDNNQVHFQLAQVYGRLGDRHAAVREAAIHQRLLNASLKRLGLSERELQSDDPQIVLSRAQLLAAHGEYGAAADLYRGVLAVAPHDTSASQELSQLEKAHPNETQSSVVLTDP